MWRRYTCIRQHDSSDCGAAALATIARHYRRPIGLQQMRELAGTDRAGTNLFGLLRGAEQLGFAARAVQGEYDALGNVPLPAIAHIINKEGLGHFVVVHRVTARYVVVADPASGVRKMSRAEFTQAWTGYLLMVVPEARPTAATRSSSGASPWARLFSLLAGNRAFLVEAFCCAILMTLLGVTTSYFVQHLVDSVLVRHEVRLLNALGIGMLLVMLFHMLFSVVRHYLLAYISRKIDLSLIADYTQHLLRLPMNFFEMRQIGDILSRVNDAAKIREAISGTTLMLVVDGVLIVLSATVLWIYDAQLALVATLFVPLLVACVLLHHPAVKRRSRSSMENAARLSAHLVENISGVETVKAFGVERERAEEGENRLVQLVQDVFGMQMLAMSMSSAGMFVTGVAGIVVLWYGGHRVMDGALTIGQLMFFHTLLGHMLGPLERLAGVNLQLQDALVAVDRLYQVLDVEPEPQADPRHVQLQAVRQGIELDNVSFRYGCRDEVLQNVSLTVPAGKTVAIVGESGSGKSTLLKLLMRFYDPTAGQIRIDGVDMRDYDPASLRARIGLVAQDPFIFTGTIRENIALGRPGATTAEVVQAARDAGLDEFISKLPDRYETVIGERGANLSGGQRQRLAIARALLRAPDILIFDEATSHLDTATERAIQKSLKSALAGKTVILVAHRLSTIRHADLICVLDQGQIAESGNHADLIARDARYAALWRAQRGDDNLDASRAFRAHRLNGHANKGALNYA